MDMNHQFAEGPQLDNQNKFISFKRRPGTAGIRGQLYEIQLIMWFLLKAEKMFEEGRINRFYLATNMMEAGNFDDVVFQCDFIENGVAKSKRIFLQAKHKEASKNITIDTLLSQTTEKADINLRKYLSTYQKINRLAIENHPIFGCSTCESEYVIFTNASFEINKCDANVDFVELQKDHILCIEDSIGERRPYCSLRMDETVLKALRPSIDYEILIKELAQSISTRYFDKNKSIFRDYQPALEEYVIFKINPKQGKIREEFVDGNIQKEFRNALFKELLKRKRYAALKGNNLNDFKELRCALKEEIIDMPSHFSIDAKNKLPLPTKLIDDSDIKEFLKQLKIFTSQPNEDALGEIIKTAIREMLNVKLQNVESVFSIVENRIKQWWKSGDEYITEGTKYYQTAADKSIWFDVRRPVKSFVGREEKMKILHDKIQKDSNRSHIILIYGSRGIGKTELARRYIQEHSYSHYDNNIVWINAESEVAIAESLSRLAKEKLAIYLKYPQSRPNNTDLMTTLEEAYAIFKERRSLFIFDDVEDKNCMKKLLALNFMRIGENMPYILITSRMPELSRGIETLHLNELKTDEAIEFVKKGLKANAQSLNYEITNMVKHLCCLPFALQLAISYIKTHREACPYTISNYLEAYTEKKKELLNNKELSAINDEEFKINATCCLMVLDKIRGDSEHGALAIKMLQVMAFLATESIRRDFFLDIAKGNEEELLLAVRVMVTYSVINGDSTESSLRISGLVQNIVRLEMTDLGKEEEILRLTLQLLVRSWKEDDLKHAMSAWNHASKIKKLVEDFNFIPCKMIRNLCHLGRHHEAKLFGNEILNILDDVTGPYQDDTILHRAASNGNVEEILLILSKLREKHGTELTVSINTKNEEGNTPLMVAAEFGNTEAAKILIENGADPNVRNSHDMTALHGAAEHGHRDLTALLIDKNSGLLFAEDKTCSVLHKAAMSGNEEVIRLILKKIKTKDYSIAKKIINAKNVDGNTPLICAAHRGNISAVRALIYFEADLKVRNNKGLTALHISAERGHLEVTELLSKDNIIHLLEDNDYDSVLHRAAFGGNLEIVSLILRKVKDYDPSVMYSCVNAINVQGKSPLLIASEAGNISVARILLEHGADPRETKSGLQSAVEHGHLGVTELLLGKRKLGELLLDRNSISLLHRAALGANGKVVRLILKKIREDDPSQISQCINAKTERGETPLMYAAQFGNTAVARVLLENGAESNIQMDDGSTAMHIAVENGHLETTKLLYKDKVNLLIDRNNDAGSFIHRAAVGGNIEVMNLILEGMISNETGMISQQINERNSNGCTPLVLAAKNGHISIAELLIEKGADLKIRDTIGLTALHCAVESGQLRTTELLLNYSKADALFDTKYETVLHSAVCGGSKEVVELILSKISGERNRKLHIINLFHERGKTPLMAAAEKGFADIAKLLIEHGAKPFMENITGFTALHYAAELGSLEITEMLANAYPQVLHSSQGNPILHSAAFGGKVEVVQLLLDKIWLIDQPNFKAHINASNKNDLTPLMMAAQHGYSSVAKLLIDHGADPNKRNDIGSTALHIAANFGHIETTEWLSTVYPEILLRHECNTVLHRSVLGGNVEVTRLILKTIKLRDPFSLDAHVNAKNMNDLTPLMIAAKNGNTPVAKLLTEYDAIANLRNNVGSTALHISAEFQHIETTEWLSNIYPEILLNLNTDTVLNSATLGGNAEVCRLIINKVISRSSCDLNAYLNAKNANGKTPLMIAAENGNLTVVKLLITYGADLRIRNETGLTALHTAAFFGHLEATEWLSNTYPNIVLNLDTDTVLNSATLGGNAEVCRLIITKVISRSSCDLNAYLNAKNANGKTPLMIAAENGNFAVVKLLITYGADLRIRNETGLTALHIAAFFGHLEATEWMSNANPEMLVNFESISILHKAAMGGNVEVARFILNKLKARDPANLHNYINVKIRNDLTPLMIAAEKEDSLFSKLLTLYRSDPSLRKDMVPTAFLTANEFRHRQTTEWLSNVCPELLLNLDNDTELYSAVINGNAQASRCKLNRVNSRQSANLHEYFNTKNKGDLTPLMLSARHGNSAIVKLLIEYGADAGIKNGNGSTALHIAAEFQYIEITEWLSDKYPELLLNLEGDTVLHSAALGSNVELTRLLLNKIKLRSFSHLKDHINARNKNGWTPLMIAAQKGNTTLVELLVDSGAHRSIKKGVSTALHIAAYFGHPEATVWLSNAYPDILLSLDGDTVLHSATLGGNIEVFQIILNKIKEFSDMNSYINAKNNNDWTPLMMAAKKGNTTLAKLLKENGAELSMRNDVNLTALHIATYFGHLETTKWLLNAYPEILLNLVGNTVLHTAALGGNVEVTQYILNEIKLRDPSNFQSYVNAKNQNNLDATPLMTAVQNGNTLAGKLLIEYGADHKMRNRACDTALHIAVRFGHIETTEWLSNTYPEILLNVDDNTVLFTAAVVGNVDLTRLLLNKIKVKHLSDLYSCVNAKNTDWTPLLIAAKKGYLGVAKLLMKHGADPNVSDKFGFTALEMLRERSK